MTKPNRAERRRAAKKADKDEARQPYFDEIAEQFVSVIKLYLADLRGRTSGAQAYGPDGLFIAGLETLHVARSRGSADEYLRAGAYALAAAMKLVGVWDTAPRPAPAVDDAQPESPPDACNEHPDGCVPGSHDEAPPVEKGSDEAG